MVVGSSFWFFVSGIWFPGPAMGLQIQDFVFWVQCLAVGSSFLFSGAGFLFLDAVFGFGIQDFGF